MTEAIKMIKPGKAEGPSGIIVEMIKAGEERMLLRY